jgi:hypothetical protein
VGRARGGRWAAHFRLIRESKCVVSDRSTYLGDAASCRNERGTGVLRLPAGSRLQEHCCCAMMRGGTVSGAKSRTTPRQQHPHVSSDDEMGQCGSHRWVEHKFEGSMFCRRVVDTLASIKPAVICTSTNEGALENSAAIVLLLSFHWPRAPVQPASLGGVLQVDGDAALGIALEIASARKCRCFCCFAKQPKRWWLPVCAAGMTAPFARSDNVCACAELCTRTRSVASFHVRAYQERCVGCNVLAVSATGEVGDRRRGTPIQNKHGVACDHGAGTCSLQR